MRIRVIFLFLLFSAYSLPAQVADAISIHRYENEKFTPYIHSGRVVFDSLNGFTQLPVVQQQCGPLQRRVFGYHPYWGGSNFLNYQWGLLSDFCHFSYEVDPATGLPLTTHEWETSAAIDSAFAHGVNVHLCVTLFSGHSTFFPNPVARQNLIDQVIQLISLRGAHGVNMDVEALPSSQKEAFLDFMIDLCTQMDQQLPDAEVSIAAPAVNWNEKFNVPVLNEYIDFFMVMAYDYYWGGSAIAGPVSPQYAMSGSFNYSFSRTLSYYQSQGVLPGKLIMGVPYYAYQWKTEGQYAPSATIGTGAAYTYRYIRDNNSGNYSPENKHMEGNSFAPYFSFESDGWNQCFLDDIYSMGEKYDIVNRRKLGGIGIWALGYDNGYTDLWNLIAEKFTADAVPVDADTLYDSGGPAFDYYDDENYTYSLTSSIGTTVYLSFSYLDTEENYDTLWIYDGPDVLSPLVGIFTGNGVPGLIQSSSNALTLRFYSDGATTDAGWRAVYDTLPVSGVAASGFIERLHIWPNPAHGKVIIEVPGTIRRQGSMLELTGICRAVKVEIPITPGQARIVLDASSLASGSYLVLIFDDQKLVGSGKLIVE